MADFILRLGVQFRPRDVNARQIRQQIARAIGAVTVSIERASFSRGAKDRLKNSFQSIAFQIERASFSSNARRALQRSFGAIAFRLERTGFSRRGRSELQRSFRRIPFTIGALQISAAAQRQLQSQLSNVQVTPGATRAGDALAAQAQAQFRQRQRPPTIGAAEFQQIQPERLARIAQEFNNIAGATTRLRGVANQARALRSVGDTLGLSARQARTLTTNLQGTATQLSAVQGRAAQTRATLEQLQLARRAQEASRLARANLQLVQAEDQATRSTRQLTNVLRQSGGSAEVFGARLAQITTRFAQYLISVRAIIAAQQLFNATLDSIVRFDNVLADLQKVLQVTPNELANVAEGLFRVAEETSRSFDEVGTALNTFVRAGLTVEEALERSRAALIAVNVTELEAAEATRLITSALQVFRDELEDPIEFLDKLVVSADNAATNAGQVGQAFLRSASAAREAGVGFEQLLGIIAATLEETQLQSGQVGTALKTIFTRLVSNADQLRETANQFGANIRAGDSLVEVLGKLARVFDRTSIAQRTQLGLLVGGRRQFNIFAGVLNNFEKSQELVEKQADSTGNALAKNEVELSKLSAQARLVATNFDQLVNAIAGTGEGAEGAGRIRGLLADALNIANSFLSAITDLVQRLNRAGAVVRTITDALRGAVTIGLLAIGGRIIRGLISGFRQFLQIGGLIRNTLVEIGNVSQTQVSREQQINAQLQQRVGLLTRIRSFAAQPIGQAAGQVVGGAQRFVGAVRGGGVRGALERGRERLVGALRGLRDELRSPTRFFRGDTPRGRAGDQALVAGRRQLAGIVALGAISSVASENLKKFADSIRAGGTETDQFKANLLDASGSALQLGVVFGALTGSLKFGLAAGVLAFIGSIRAARLRTIESSQALGRFIQDVETAGNFTIEQLRDGFGGEILQRAVEQVRGPLDELDDSLVLNVQTLSSQANLIQQSGMELSAALELSKNAIDDFSEVVSQFAATQQFRRQVADAETDARGREVAGELRIGGLAGQEDIVDPFSEIVALSEQITTGLASSATQTERLNTAFEAGRAILEDQNATVGDIVDEFNLQSESSARAQLEAERITSEIEQQERALRAVLDEQEAFKDALAATVAESDKAAQAAAGQADAGGRAFQNAEALERAESRRAELLAEIQGREETIRNIQQNLDQLGQQRTRVVQVEAQEQAAIADKLARIQTLSTQIAAGARDRAIAVREETAGLTDSNRDLERRVEIQRGLLDLERNRGTLLEQFEARQGAVREEALIAVDRQIEAGRRNVQALVTLANRLEGASPELAESVRGAAQDLQAALRDEEAALRAEIELQIQPALEAQAFEELKRTEEQLRDIRLEGINQVLDLEARRFQQEQEQIEQLGQFLTDTLGTSNLGEQILGDRGILDISSVRRLRQVVADELEGISTEARQVFGDVGSILVRNTLAAFEQIANRGREILEQVAQIRDPAQRRQQAARVEQQIIERNEQAIQFIRERILQQLRSSADRATTAEELLKRARDRVTAATNKVRSAEDNLAQAEEAVAQAQDRLNTAIQAAKDAQVDYNVAVASARFNVLQSTGALRSFGEQISALSAISAEAQRVVGASEEKILEIRAQIAQEAISIFQNQFDAIQGLGVRAATASLDEFVDLQTGLAAAGQVLAGGGADLPPEILQLASQFTDIFPGLERAIAEIGLERLGIDPGVLEDIEGRMLELAEVTADSAQVGVVQAEKQVAVAQEQLNEARQQREIAKEQLGSAREQEARAKENLEQAQRTAVETRSGFSRQAALAQQSLQQLSGSFVLGQRSLEVLAQSRNLQREAVDQLRTLNSRVSNLSVGGGGGTPNAASGTLTGSEIAGVIAAARREKRGMPPGSSLMLANTSETVLTRSQARNLGLRPTPRAFAQEGNAQVTGELSTVAQALMQTIGEIRSAVTQGNLVQQNIQVQVDQNRTVDIRGVDQIDVILRNTLRDQFGQTATRTEQDALRRIIVGMVERLNETGIVNSRGF